jgi:hypothetical protein
MKTPVICYPRGSGGNWLGNLIWRLEVDDFKLPSVDVVFDGHPQSNRFLYSHVFNIFDGKTPVIDNIPDADLIKFSSPCWFNHYINDAVKVRYHIINIGTLTVTDQFHLLTDSAIYIRTDSLWQETWKTPGELEYSLLYSDPKKFVDQLFVLLNQYNVKYTPNREYCYANIEYYKSTCPCPSEHLNNFNSLLWLAWCHAELLISGVGLQSTVPADATVDIIRQLVEPVTPLYLIEQTKLITAERKE